MKHKIEYHDKQDRLVEGTFDVSLEPVPSDMPNTWRTGHYFQFYNVFVNGRFVGAMEDDGPNYAAEYRYRMHSAFKPDAFGGRVPFVSHWGWYGKTAWRRKNLNRDAVVTYLLTLGMKPAVRHVGYYR